MAFPAATPVPSVIRGSPNAIPVAFALPRVESCIYAGLWIAVIALKFIAIFHLRADSDETQHAHVVWGWATGRLQYRDLFDNHMPLFQMLCAPLLRLLGERSDILIWLRFAMLPLYSLGLWCVFRLTTILFNRRAAVWTVLLAAAWYQFFYTATEFRTDDLWTAIWLATLVVLVSGEFTIGRAFSCGLLLGLAFAVSLKTIALVLALASAAALALAIAWFGMGKAISWRDAVLRASALLVGMLIAPAVIALYFVSRNAFWIMYYCVIQHNLVPGLKTCGASPLLRWTFPVSIPLLAAYAFFIQRQCVDEGIAIRRMIVVLAPLFYVAILISYWPEVTREDALPYAPLLPLVPLPFLTLHKRPEPIQEIGLAFHRWALPLLGICEIVVILNTNNLRQNRLSVTNHSIADVLLLTGFADYVMDDKGDYIFRPRPYYWVLEPMTVIRATRGLIDVNIQQRLEDTGTKVCYFWTARRASEDVPRFIARNYLPFDPKAIDLGVAGKELSSPPDSGAYEFDVRIPATYSVLSEFGDTEGALDGKRYRGPVPITPGHHEFVRTAGTGKAAIMLADAVASGFRPLFTQSEKFIAETGTIPAVRPHPARSFSPFLVKARTNWRAFCAAF